MLKMCSYLILLFTYMSIFYNFKTVFLFKMNLNASRNKLSLLIISVINNIFAINIVLIIDVVFHFLKYMIYF